MATMAIIWHENEWKWSEIDQIFIENKSVLIHVVAWRRTGAKPLPEPTFRKIYDVTWRHKATLTYDKHRHNHDILATDNM